MTYDIKELISQGFVPADEYEKLHPELTSGHLTACRGSDGQWWVRDMTPEEIEDAEKNRLDG